MKLLLRNGLIGIVLVCVILLFFPSLRPKEGLFLFLEQPVSYHNAVKRASPSVVNLYTKVQKESSSIYLPLGSGVIINPKGYIVTNFHVIDGVNDVVVALQDGQTFNAMLLGQDKVTDIAVLKVEATNLPSIPLRLDRKPNVGDVVLAIGNPYNIGQTITQGIISAIDRDGLTASKRQNFIQTDASINHGNSGGALVNSLGEFVGLNTLSFSKSNNYEVPEGIGFAIPADLVVKIMNTLITEGKVERGYIGLEGSEINPKLRDASIDYLKGIFITNVSGTAKTADLLPNDIIVEIDHKPIESIVQAMNQIMDFKQGSVIPILYYRNGVLHSTEVKVESYPD